MKKLGEQKRFNFIPHLISEIEEDGLSELNLWDKLNLLPRIIEAFIHCVVTGNCNWDDLTKYYQFMRSHLVESRSDLDKLSHNAFGHLLTVMLSTENWTINIHRMAMMWLIWYDQELIGESTDIQTFKYSGAL